MNFVYIFPSALRLSMITVLLGLLVSCQSSPDVNQEALDLLKKVEQRYESADALYLKATITTEINSGKRNRTIDIPLTYKTSPPGKMRLEVNHSQANITLVSNGSTTWTYLASKNQYTRKQASILQEGQLTESESPTDQQFLDLARGLTDTYSEITKHLKSAQIIGRRELTLNSQSSKTYLVEATYKNDLKSERPDAQVEATKYWIDPNNHLVLKQADAYSLPSRRTNDSVDVQETTIIKDYELAPSFSSETFSFQPPEDAQLVNNLRISGGSNSTMEGREAPSFTLPDLKGEKVRLKDFRGKIVLLDFWATWCAPCRRAHPAIQELHKKYHDQGLEIIGINNESRRTARSYMEKHGYTFTTLLDVTDRVAGKYNVSGIPYYVVINRKGKISSQILGYHPKSDMLKALREAGLDVN